VPVKLLVYVGPLPGSEEKKCEQGLARQSLENSHMILISFNLRTIPRSYPVCCLPFSVVSPLILRANKYFCFHLGLVCFSPAFCRGKILSYLPIRCGFLKSIRCAMHILLLFLFLKTV